MRARSPLIDREQAAPEPAGRDSASLGPSDSSDSGSDLTGAAPDDGAATDAAGTGERRGVAGDADAAEATDIGVDRVFEPPPPHDEAGPPAADTTQSPGAIGTAAQQRPRARGNQHGGRRSFGEKRKS